jgi:hypothetical protein
MLVLLREGFKNHVAGMDSGAMIYIPSFFED